MQWEPRTDSKGSQFRKVACWSSSLTLQQSWQQRSILEWSGWEQPIQLELHWMSWWLRLHLQHHSNERNGRRSSHNHYGLFLRSQDISYRLSNVSAQCTSEVGWSGSQSAKWDLWSCTLWLCSCNTQMPSLLILRVWIFLHLRIIKNKFIELFQEMNPSSSRVLSMLASLSLSTDCLLNPAISASELELIQEPCTSQSLLHPNCKFPLYLDIIPSEE